jgi:predicted MPP superfamily phosphohydrolase
MRRFPTFLVMVTTILSVSAFYVGIRLLTTYAWAAENAGWVWLALAGVVALQFIGPFLYRSYPDRLEQLRFVSWSTYLALGAFGTLILYTLAADIVVVLWGLFNLPGDARTWAYPAVGIFAVATVVVGFWQAVSGPRVYEVDVPLAGLPEAFAGFRIVQISDLHLGPTLGKRFTEKVVARTNALAPDVVALTGDFVDGNVATLRGAVEPLSGLKPREATFFIPGNHEYYWGVEAWMREFSRLGAAILLNEHAVIRRGGSALVIAGVADYNAGHMIPEHASDPVKALRGAPAGAPRILLAHHPESHLDAEPAGFQLQLSGHTHGGQFFPFSLLVRMTHRHCKGLYRIGEMWLYVSRGTGYWGPPIRFGVPAEITLIRLSAASPATSSAAASPTPGPAS